MDQGWARATATLGAIGDHFAAHGVELPARRYVSAGDIAFDCDQLTVTLVSYYGTNGDVSVQTAQPMRCNTLRGTLFEVMLLRCAPTIEGTPEHPKLPDPAELETYGRLIMNDAEMLEAAIVDAWGNGVYGDGPNLVIENYDTVGPIGGLGGGFLRFRVGMW